MWVRYAPAVLVLMALNETPVFAASITVDEILHASDINAALLSGDVTMTLSGSTLAITLQNTSRDLAGSGAGVLLTGLGFQLPTGVMIQSGRAHASTKGDVSKHWGYDNDPLNSGAFKNAGFLDYSDVVGSMTSITSTTFKGPKKLRGPDYGLASALETDDFGRGLKAIWGDLSIQLILNVAPPDPDEFLRSIQAGNVALSFGSPTLTTVPEPGSLSLLGVGLASVAAFLRRKRKREKQSLP